VNFAVKPIKRRLKTRERRIQLSISRKIASLVDFLQHRVNIEDDILRLYGDILFLYGELKTSLARYLLQKEKRKTENTFQSICKEDAGGLTRRMMIFGTES